jgi:hypothetical protein
VVHFNVVERHSGKLFHSGPQGVWERRAVQDTSDGVVADCALQLRHVGRLEQTRSPLPVYGRRRPRRRGVPALLRLIGGRFPLGHSPSAT